METNQLKEIYKIMTDNGYDEIELKIGESDRVRMVREKSGKAGCNKNKSAVNNSKERELSTATKTTNDTVASQNTEICSELVGIFQFMDTDENYWPKVGDSVAMGEKLGKITNLNNSVKEIKSPIDGRIVKIAIGHESIVDYGRLLFVIEAADESKG